MANKNSSKTIKGSATRASGRHMALGRGLGALIPTQVSDQQPDSNKVDPLDVLFPGRPNGTGARARGGSAKELLTPGGMTASKRRKKSRSAAVSPQLTPEDDSVSKPVSTDVFSSRGGVSGTTNSRDELASHSETNSSDALDGVGASSVSVASEVSGTSATSDTSEVSSALDHSDTAERLARSQQVTWPIDVAESPGDQSDRDSGSENIAAESSSTNVQEQTLGRSGANAGKRALESASPRNPARSTSVDVIPTDAALQEPASTALEEAARSSSATSALLSSPQDSEATTAGDHIFNSTSVEESIRAGAVEETSADFLEPNQTRQTASIDSYHVEPFVSPELNSSSTSDQAPSLGISEQISSARTSVNNPSVSIPSAETLSSSISEHVSSSVPSEPVSLDSVGGRGSRSPAPAKTQTSSDSGPTDSGEHESEAFASSESVVAPDHSELLIEDVEANVSRETLEGLVPVPGASFAEIPLEYIVPNTRQPREVFDEDDLEELRDSILEVGILQPIVVRPIDFSIEPNARMQAALDEKPDARFELIMGERRLRACELAELESVPAIIKETEDQDLLRDALLENLHRAQLNPLEEASAYQQLMADFGATQEQLSKKVARSRSQIANTLRLLKLPPSVQKKVAAQVISAGHARALLSLTSPLEMERLADRIVAEGLSVRTTEELVRLGRSTVRSRPRQKRTPVVSPLGESVVSAFEEIFETRVTIKEGLKRGKIVIEYAGSEDLERIAQVIAHRRI